MQAATLKYYLAKCILKGIAIAFFCVLALIMLVDFVEASRNIGSEAGVKAWQVFGLTLLKTPHLIEETIPFIVLFGVMGALYGLNRRSELIVLRAAGLSAWRFLAPAVSLAALIGILWSFLFNPLAAQMLGAHDKLAESLSATPRTSPGKAIWLREGSELNQTVIHAPRADVLSATLFDVTFYVFKRHADGSSSFERRFDAQRAKLTDQGYWQLQTIIENSEGEPPRRLGATSMPTTITHQSLRNSAGADISVPFWALPAAIKKTKQAGFSTIPLRLQLHKLLALPVMLIAMTIIAAGVSMRLARSGGALRLLVSGGAAGFIVFFTNNIVSAFGEAAILPLSLAAWATPLLVLCLGLAYLSHIEDG